MYSLDLIISNLKSAIHILYKYLYIYIQIPNGSLHIIFNFKLSSCQM